MLRSWLLGIQYINQREHESAHNRCGQYCGISCSDDLLHGLTFCPVMTRWIVDQHYWPLDITMGNFLAEFLLFIDSNGAHVTHCFSIFSIIAEFRKTCTVDWKTEGENLGDGLTLGWQIGFISTPSVFLLLEKTWGWVINHGMISHAFHQHRMRMVVHRSYSSQPWPDGNPQQKLVARMGKWQIGALQFG